VVQCDPDIAKAAHRTHKPTDGLTEISICQSVMKLLV